MAPPDSRCSKCRRYCRRVTTFLFSHVGLCGLVVGYSIVGAFTFEALEAGYELEKRRTMLRERETLVSDLWMLTAGSSVLSEINWTSMAIETLQDFETTLVKAVRKEGYDGKDESPLQWTFSGALLYSIIVITTIGYGNIAPKTSWGKVVTVLYAIIGIPLLLLCLSNIGDAMAHSFKFIYWKVCCYLCVRPKKRRKRVPLHKPMTLPYHKPPVQNTIHQRPVQSRPVTESPNLASSSTYHTAQSHSSPTISSSTSSPINELQPYIPVSASLITSNMNNGHFQGHTRDIPLAPVITNKYALQEDVHVDGQLKLLHGNDCSAVRMDPSIFTILDSKRLLWKQDQAYQDTNLNMLEGDDSYSQGDMNESLEDDEEVSVPMWLCVALVVGYICGGAVLFTFWEKWNFLDSSYFCFVTLTTIGFGDLVPGTAVISDDNQLTLGLCSLYLLFGMALLAMSFNLVQEEVTRSVRCVGKRIGIISDDEDD
ncbi:TWiK family of potassium channels protein 18-like [Uloborus diversus]|uniref:TWiK family of potassium channels protein 18-like n=1 Tax=Uloborus diversus TaxID=327109 RepID=UPI00240A4E45|nr:TWiK family of potassium channels protein 18-like [Uloborus diversus]